MPTDRLRPADPEAVDRILVVEDDRDQRTLVSGILAAEGYLVTAVGTLAEARAALGQTPLDVVLSDWKLPDGNGNELLAELKRDYPGIAFVMVTAYGSISRAVEAVRLGADDYLAKPFERQALLLSLEKARRSSRLETENRRLNEALGDRDRLVGLVGGAPSMQRLFRQVERLAGTAATILLSGESGTGKELAARALHTLSRRSGRPFIAVNCAAIPENLLESEFFGVEKGAFTGADRSRSGNFDAADGGTLFLDEIGELPLAIQPKLLRVLQDGSFSRVGSTRERSADVRIIAASNRDLLGEVKEGRFRQDLYYRLAVVPLSMPPLRDRREDIPKLMEHFAGRAARRHGRSVPAFPPKITKRFIDYEWPGNVRELANAVERLLLLATDDGVSVDDLPEEMVRPAGFAEPEFEVPREGFEWEVHERSCLAQALEHSDGNRAQAARMLGLPYKAFLYRLEKHDLG